MYTQVIKTFKVLNITQVNCSRLPLKLIFHPKNLGLEKVLNQIDISKHFICYNSKIFVI
jgi:hypothetical protein